MTQTKTWTHRGARLAAADIAPGAEPGRCPLAGHAGLKTCRDR